MRLEELAKKHDTDKLWHGYVPRYATHFAELRHRPIRMVEIGVASGASMRTWNDYFDHPETFIMGLEINPDNPGDISKRAVVITTDGTNAPYNGPQLDIIIDDGSHISKDILAAIENWWKHLKSGGWYVIEDLAVQWRSDYGGGEAGSLTTWSLRDFMDQLLKHDESFITEMHVYNEIVFLRKA